MSKLKYRACQRVRFTAADTLREGVIDFALSPPEDGDPFDDTIYDIQDDHGRMFYAIPEVQVYGLAVVREADAWRKAVRDFEEIIDQLRGRQP